MQMLFISSFHPDAVGIMGAGEAISGSSIRRFIKAGYEIDVIVNAPGSQRANPEIVSIVSSYTTLTSTKTSKLISLISNVFKGSLLSPYFFTRVSPQLRKTVDDKIRSCKYDILWIDFPSSLGLVSHLKSYKCNVYYFVHDVVYQKTSRKILGRLLSFWVRKTELHLINKCSQIYCLSEKDFNLLVDYFAGEICIEEDINTAYGSVDGSISSSEIIKEFSQKVNLVFFGNMSRKENSLSILFFILLSFFRIKNKSIHLWVVGIGPTTLLRLMDKLFDRVHITGAVDNPDLFFINADLCIVPLLFGAGVKIKVLQMLKAGSFVLSTDIGAEGIEPNSQLLITRFFDFPNMIDKILYDKVSRSDI